MKIIRILLISLIAAVGAKAQDPVSWSFSSKKISDGIFEIRFSATIEKGWHIYALSGLVSTKIEINRNSLITIDGNMTADGVEKEKYEPSFGAQVKYYNDKVDFVQRIKLKRKVKTNITGSLEYITCNEQQCLPPVQKKFSIPVGN